MSKEAIDTFGHSFEEGEINWQFHIVKSDEHAATLQLFSWLTGEPTDQVVKSWAWINENCRLYQSEEAWLKAGAAPDATT